MKMDPSRQRETDMLLGNATHIYDLTISFKKEEDRKAFIKQLNKGKGFFDSWTRGFFVGVIVAWLISAIGVLIHMALFPIV